VTRRVVATEKLAGVQSRRQWGDRATRRGPRPGRRVRAARSHPASTNASVPAVLHLGAV